jgi:lipopolysaccharide export system permease protein
VEPGQFQESAGGKRVFFVEKNLSAQQSASNVFIATAENGKETVTSARSGRIERIEDDKFLILENGQRLENSIGKKDLKISEFSVYGLVVEPGLANDQSDIPLNTRSMLYLVGNPNASNLGEISWRLGFLLAATNLLIIAVASSRVNPRVGRAGNLIFSLLLFQVYLNLLNLGQNWIATSQISFSAFMLLLHGGGLLASLLWLSKRHHNWQWWPTPKVKATSNA